MKNFYLLALLSFFLLPWINAQDSGDMLFDNSLVHEIKITFEEPDFWNILTSNYSNSTNNEGVATDVPYLMGSISIDDHLMDSIGLRQKGFSSHFLSPNEFKKSLKLDFNEFVSGQNYDGVKKVNLANGVGDPAMQRDFLAYNIMRKAGINAPRTSYAKVFLNDEYWGLYLIVEQVDKTFLNNNFSSGDGDLYKNIGWSTLNWQGDQAEDYASSIALRTNELTSDFSDFIEFIDILNNTPDSSFADSIVSVFNVDYFLKVLAVDVMTDNWDSYLDHGRNFYLYHEPTSDQFHWVPWDYNFSMGGDFGFGDGGGGDELPDDAADCESILNGSCLYAPTDTAFIATINVDAYCCNVDWDGVCQEIYDDILENGVQGVELPDDAADCQSIQDGSCPYPADDLIFLQVISNEPSCCNDTWSGGCQSQYDQLNSFESGPNFLDLPLIVDNSETILINRILDVPSYRERYLTHCCEILEHNVKIDRLEPIIDYNGALISEAVLLDPNHAFSFDYFQYDISPGDNSKSIPSLKEFFNHRIPVLEENLMELGNVCQSLSTTVIWQEVVINEFMASNDSLSLIVDQDDEADDWIELYNNTAETIDLSDFYMTDNFDSPTTWRFPQGTTIDADGYLIVWADKDLEQNGLHADFKLAAGGEQIMLVHLDGTVIDSFSYAIQTTNISSARIPNGTGDFVTDIPVTFNGNNDFTDKVINLEYLPFSIYPSPAHDQFTIALSSEMNGGQFDIRVSNLLGQLLYSGTSAGETKITIPITKWTPGMYLIELSNDKYRGLQKLIKE